MAVAAETIPSWGGISFKIEFVLYHILSICSSEVATVFKDWNENPASSSKKRLLPVVETQLEREKIGQEVSKIFYIKEQISSCLR